MPPGTFGVGCGGGEGLCRGQGGGDGVDRKAVEAGQVYRAEVAAQAVTDDAALDRVKKPAQGRCTRLPIAARSMQAKGHDPCRASSNGIFCPDQLHLTAEATVFHDIWGYCDFYGTRIRRCKDGTLHG